MPLLALFALLVVGCHRFPTEADATRWPAPPTGPGISNVTGRVLHEGDSTPIAGATVWINDVTDTSDASGNFNLAGVRGPQVLVFAAKPGFDTTSTPLLLSATNLSLDLRLTAR